MIVDERVAARGTVYGTIAGLFEEPEEDVFENLANGAMSDDLSLLVDQSGLEVEVPTLVPSDDYDLLCARFNDIFEIGYPDPPVPLYESEYRENGNWDETNMDLARVYDFFGVSVDDSQREHHDHLQLELEFVGYLGRLAATTEDIGVRKARLDFLDRHLVPFLQGIESAIQEETNTGIYTDLVVFGTKFAAKDLSELESREYEEVSPP